MLTSMATGFPSRPAPPSPPTSRVFGLTVLGNVLLAISVLAG